MEDLERIKTALGRILERRFSDEPAKQNIVERTGRLNFSCPYCGDSSNVYKKRGNIYCSEPPFTFHCFNCGEHRSLGRFFKDYGIDGFGGDDIEYKARPKTIATPAMFNGFLSYAVPLERVALRYHLTPITPDCRIYGYMQERLIPARRYGDFMWSENRQELYLLHRKGDGVLGVQIRSFDPDRPKYRTLNLSRLLEDTRDPRAEAYKALAERGVYDRWSMCFGIASVDLRRPVVVTEGFIDSLFLPNAVSTSGARNLPDLLLGLDDAVWVYDNDATGRERAEKALGGGHRVFLWKKFLALLGLTAGRVKDINDFIRMLHGQNKTAPDAVRAAFVQSVSDNALDVIYL